MAASACRKLEIVILIPSQTLFLQKTAPSLSLAPDFGTLVIFRALLPWFFAKSDEIEITAGFALLILLAKGGTLNDGRRLCEDHALDHVFFVLVDDVVFGPLPIAHVEELVALPLLSVTAQHL
jgi:hypothetical protein